jgi:hypothetical protein
MTMSAASAPDGFAGTRQTLLQFGWLTPFVHLARPAVEAEVPEEIGAAAPARP